MDIDFLLIHQIKNGDAHAGERLIRKYYPEIFRYCCLHISDRCYAEDITQETFVHFFAALGRYEHQGKISNYLYTIATNLCRNYYKKAKEIPLDDIPEQLVDLTSETDSIIDVKVALEHLPIELREVTILYYYRNRTLKEIAAILGISPTLVRRRLERAKDRLRTLLEGDAL